MVNDINSITAKLSAEIGPDMLKICVIGIGGAGASVVTDIYNKKIKNVETVIINTMSNDKTKANKIVKIQSDILGEHEDSEGFVEIGQALISQSMVHIIQIIQDSDFVFLVSGLGGGLGTGGLIEILREIQKRKLEKFVTVIGILPFKFESRQETANSAKLQVSNLAIRTVWLYNDSFIHDPNRPIARVLEDVNTHIAGIITKASTILEEVRTEIVNEYLTPAVQEAQLELPKLVPEIQVNAQIS